MTAPRHTQNFLGAVLLAVSWIFFTTEMVTARILSEDLSLPQITAVRLATQALVLLPVLIFSRGALFRTARFGMHLLRSGLSASGMMLFYLTFSLLPVAMATTLTFTQAMFVTLLAAAVLSETIGARRIAAVIVGFGGVLVVMRPGFSGFDPAMLVAIAGAFVAALLMIVTRALSATEGRLTIMLYSAWLGLLLISVPAALTWVSVRPDQWPLLGLLSVAGTIGQFLMVGAFQVAEASALAPVDYVRLVFAVAAGYFLFAEIPDLWTWTGAAIVVGSVVYTAHRERAAAKTETG